jgi:ABC-type polar amino acid transport system ATPase subunit
MSTFVLEHLSEPYADRTAGQEHVLKWVTIRELAEHGMTCIIVTHEIAFAREVADQVYLVIEHALSGVMTSPTDCGVPR